MKKTFALMIAVFAFAMIFNSCEKEGQYMPKKKISEIVYTKYYKFSTGTIVSRTEREVWTWNGKLLSYIDYYKADDTRTTSLFRYDNENRIEEINYGDATAKFDYDNGLIDEITIYNQNGSLLGKYEFEHKGNTLTAIDVTTNGSKSMEMLPFNPLRIFLPEGLVNKVMEGAATKGSTRVLLTWSGKNITSAEVTGGNKVTYKWSYDEYSNPLKGLFDMATTDSYVIFSKNNVVREEITTNNATTTTDFKYTYDNKYPVKKTWETVEHVMDIDYTVNCTTEYRY